MQAINASSSSTTTAAATTTTELIETELMTAISNGELQQALDDIDPDTLVRIEEGQVRQRADPVGVYSIAGQSYSTAIIGCIVGCVVVLILVCLWCLCCSGTNGRSKKTSKRDMLAVEGPPKKQGWFG